MNQKILVTIIIPIFELEYELYIPNNKKVGTIKKQVLKSIGELWKDNCFKTEKETRFIDRETGIEFQNNTYVKDSGIKNGTSIVLVWRKENYYGY